MEDLEAVIQVEELPEGFRVEAKVLHERYQSAKDKELENMELYKSVTILFKLSLMRQVDESNCF